MKETHWDLVARASGYMSFKDLLEDLYNNKRLSIEAIANELTIHRTTVLRRMHEYNIKPRPVEAFSISLHEATNLTVEQIAHKYKVTHSTAWRAKKRAKERP